MSEVILTLQLVKFMTNGLFLIRIGLYRSS